MQKIFNNFKLNSRAIVTLSVILCLFALAFAGASMIPNSIGEEPVVANAAPSTITSSNFRSAIQNNGSGGTISGEYELAGNLTINASSGVNISTFNGTFDGKGYTLTVNGNLNYDAGSNNDYYIGMIFGRLGSSAVVKNLNVVWNSYWNVKAYNNKSSADYSGEGSTTLFVGGLCGLAGNGARIEDVSFSLNSTIAGIGVDNGSDHVTQTGGQGAVVGAMIGRSQGAKLKNITFTNNGSVWARGHSLSAGSNRKGVTVNLSGPDTRGDRAAAGGIIGEIQSGSTQISNLVLKGTGYVGAAATGNKNYAANNSAYFHTINFAGGVLGFTYGGSLSIDGLLYDFQGGCYVKEAVGTGANSGAILGKGSNVSVSGLWRRTDDQTSNTVTGLYTYWSESSGPSKTGASSMTPSRRLGTNSISSLAQGAASNSVSFTNLKEYNPATTGYYDGAPVNYGKAIVTDIKNGYLTVLAQSDDPSAYISAIAYNTTQNGAFTYKNYYQNGLFNSVTFAGSEYQVPLRCNEIRVILAKIAKEPLYTVCLGDKVYDTEGITFTGAPSVTNIKLLNNLYWQAEHDTDPTKNKMGDLGSAQITTNSSAGTYKMVLYRKEANGESVPVQDGESLGADQENAPSTIYQFDYNSAQNYRYTISRAELTLKQLSSPFEKEYDGTSAVNTANLQFGVHYDFLLSDGTSPKDTPELDTENATGAFYDATGNSLDHTVGQGKVVKVSGINVVGNYQLSTSSITTLILNNCRIKPRTVTIEWGNLSQVYDGTLLKPTAIAGNLVYGDVVNTSVSLYANADDAWSGTEVSGKTNVKDGTNGAEDYYIARVTIATNPNYVIKGLNDANYLEEKFYVTKKEISLTWTKFNETFAYEDFTVTCVVTNANSVVATGDNVGLSVNYRLIDENGTEGELLSAIRNAGSYVAITSISNTNYALNSSSVRFDDVTINPILLAVEYYTGNASSVQPLVYQKVSYIGSENGLKAKASAKAVDVGLIDANIALTYDGNVDVVGSYTATATFVDSPLNPNDGIIISNYSVSNPTQSVTIVPRPITLAFGQSSFEYDGQKHIVEATIDSGLCAGDVVQIISVCYKNVDGSTPEVVEAINASTDYFVQYSINNSNYVIADGYASKSFAINKYAIDQVGSLVTIAPISNVTYTGEEVTPAVTVRFKDAPLQTINYTVSYSNNTESGTASVQVDGQNNFSGTLTTTFVIDKAVLSVLFTSNAVTTYNGEYQGVSAEFVGYKKDGDFVPMTISYGGFTPTNAGSYTATVSFSGDSRNYVLTSEISLKQFNFTIQPKPVEIEFSGYTNLTYNGLDRRYNETTNPNGINVRFVGSPICGSDDLGLALTFSGASSVPENAGRYTATASLTGNTRSNYAFSESVSNTISFDIAQYVINVIIDRLTIRHNYDSYAKHAEYTIDEATPIIAGKDPQISLAYTYVGGASVTGNNGQPLSAGAYQVQPTLNNANYKLASNEKTPFQIDPAPLRVSFLNAGEYDYDGQVKSVEYKLDDSYNFKGADNFAFSVSYTNAVGAHAEPLNVGTYKVSIKLPANNATASNYILDNANDQDYTAYSESFKINPRYLAIEFSLNSKENTYEYTGNDREVTAKVKGTGAILGLAGNSGLVLDENLEYEKVSFLVSIYEGSVIEDEFLLVGNKIKNVGTYTATATLDQANAINQNYVIYADNQVDYPTTSTIIINPKAIKFRTDGTSFTKIYGDEDGVLRLLLTKENTYEGLVGEDKLSVVLERESGENINRSYGYVGFTLYKDVGVDGQTIWEEVVGETNYSLSFGPSSDQGNFTITEKVVEFEPKIFVFDYNEDIIGLQHQISIDSKTLGNYVVTVTLSPINSDVIKKGANAGQYDLSLSFTDDNENVRCVMVPGSNEKKIHIIGKSIELS
ncbi:MAG: hypothetical protein J6R44_04415 [Clostridia bacterium]|nr:hypothetical protein [Clostridia bacterium]